jgi:hypothetical protein
MAQTSIEFLIEKVKSKDWQDMFIWHKEEVFQQAKEMHKQEIINVYVDGKISIALDDNIDHKQYYSETFNK